MSYHTQDTATTENLLRQAHRERYIRDWIFATYPATERATIERQLAHVTNGMLLDLYPHLWQHGPRGNIYMAQLRIIEHRLDAMLTPHADMSWALDFALAIREMSMLLNVKLRQQLTTSGVLWGYPSMILDPYTREQDPLFKTVNHPVWANVDAKNGFASAMRTFRTVTLYLPLLHRCEYVLAGEVIRAFNDVCTTHEISNE